MDLALAEHWDGGFWKLISSGYQTPVHPPHLPPGSKYEQTRLTGVACPSPSTCLAVGDTAFIERSGREIAGGPLAETADTSRIEP